MPSSLELTWNACFHLNLVINRFAKILAFDTINRVFCVVIAEILLKSNNFVEIFPKTKNLYIFGRLFSSWKLKLSLKNCNYRKRRKNRNDLQKYSHKTLYWYTMCVTILIGIFIKRTFMLVKNVICEKNDNIWPFLRLFCEN